MATSSFLGSAKPPTNGYEAPGGKGAPRGAFGVCLQMRAPHRADHFFGSMTVISLRRTGSRW
jgi:hypothetical protein